MKIDREQELLKYLYVSQKMTLEQAMETLGISESTARRLFSRLEQHHLAIRTHGGIQCIGSTIDSYSFEKGSHANIEQKTRIGKKACELIEDGDVVFCDSGTTIRCFCSSLILHLKKNKINVRFYTNSLANMDILSPHMEVNLIGGRYRANRKDFCGYIADQAMNGLYFSKCFLGADGYTPDSRFTTTDFETANIAETAIRNSKQSFLLVDSSKFSTASHIAYSPAENFKAVITDNGIPSDIRNELNRQGCRVILA